MIYSSDMTGRYSPLYYLAALGAGGLVVSFFMYLNWLTPHPKDPIANYASLMAAWSNGTDFARGLILVALAGIAYFAVQHVRLLVWNVRHSNAWTQTPDYAAFRKTNAETQLLAAPLAFAMSINVGFIVGAVFVPGLWEAREYLFPFAIAAFAAIGYWAMSLAIAFLTRVFATGGFDCAKNNSLGQMITVFALAMVGVGFSNPAAMSHIKEVVIIAYLLSTLFLTSAIVLGGIFLVLGFRSMLEHGAAEETTPTLWIVIPILTVVGIGLFRLKMTHAHSFGAVVPAIDIMGLLATILAIQILFGLIGWGVMKKVNYFGRWVWGSERSVGAYALICPGVALVVMGFFVVDAGLVKIGVVAPMSPLHLALHVPLVLLQFATIALMMRLNQKLLSRPAMPRRTVTA